MPNQSTPEIERLREQSWQEEYDTPGGPRKHPPVVDLDDAIQAVRDTEDRISAEVITDPFAGREDEIRREAVREIVEALRKQADQYHVDRAYEAAHVVRAMADRVERTFLNGEATRDRS